MHSCIRITKVAFGSDALIGKSSPTN